MNNNTVFHQGNLCISGEVGLRGTLVNFGGQHLVEILNSLNHSIQTSNIYWVQLYWFEEMWLKDNVSSCPPSATKMTNFSNAERLRDSTRWGGPWVLRALGPLWQVWDYILNLECWYVHTEWNLFPISYVTETHFLTSSIIVWSSSHINAKDSCSLVSAYETCVQCRKKVASKLTECFSRRDI